MEPTAINLDYPEWMSDDDKQALDDQLNALFEHRQFANEVEMNQAIQEAVETHLSLIGTLPCLPRSCGQNDYR